MKRPFRSRAFLALAATLLVACSTPSKHSLAGVRPTPGEPTIGDSLLPSSGNGGYDVQRYDLELAYDDVAGSIEASVAISARATQSLSSLYLDFHGLEIRSLEVDGAPATYTRDGDKLQVVPAAALAQGSDFRIVVTYGGVPEGVADESMPIEMPIGWMTHEGEVYVVSQPNGARSVFPCNDHPRDKALFALRVDVPAHLDAISNGRLAEVVEHDERRTFVWSPRDPMATYLFTLAIAEFDEERLEGPDGLEIVNYFTPSSKERSRADFARTPEIVTFLGDSFGPYPFERCGNVLSNLRIPLALETQTMPIYGVGVDDESVICHELAHQWFGNTVSVFDWDDIFINESLSEYAAWMYAQSAMTGEEFDKKLRAAYSIAQFTKAEPPGRVDAKSMFGTAVYMRGPLGLHFLRQEIGDEAFLGTLRSWIADHRNGNASLEEFLSHLEARTSSEAVALLRPWLYDDDMPAVERWDEELAAERRARDERRREREEERRKKKEAKEAEERDGDDGG